MLLKCQSNDDRVSMESWLGVGEIVIIYQWHGDQVSVELWSSVSGMVIKYQGSFVNFHSVE